MVKAHALNRLLLDEVEDLLDVLHIVTGQRQAQAGFLAHLMTIVEAANRAIERAFFATKLIMDLADAIERDAHIGDVGGLEQRGFLWRDERAVGGDRQLQAACAGFVHDVEKAWMNEGFTAGEEQ